METTLNTTSALNAMEQTGEATAPAWADGVKLGSVEPFTGVEFYLHTHTAGAACVGRVIEMWDGAVAVKSLSGVVWQVSDVKNFRVTAPASRGRELDAFFFRRMSRADRIRGGYECLGCGVALPGGSAAGWPQGKCNGCRGEATVGESIFC